MDKKRIMLWLGKMKVENYFINDDLTVDVNDNVFIDHKKLKEIPVQFNKVSGGFYCHRNRLTTLKGVPKSVGGSFWCDFNKLTTLKGAPSSVGGSFSCFGNQLTTLEGAPENVGGDFSCSFNELTTLEGVLKFRSVGGDFYCSNNQLTTLKGVPKNVNGGFWCYGNPLKSLDGKPNYVKGEFLIDLATYSRVMKKGEEWSLDDIDEIPAGNINIKDKIYE